jgi:hypothetical protein
MGNSGDWVTVVTATTHLSPSPTCWRGRAAQALHAWQRTRGLILERAQG